MLQISGGRCYLARLNARRNRTPSEASLGPPSPVQSIVPVAFVDGAALAGGDLGVPGKLPPDLAASVAPNRDRTVVVYCSGPACGRSRITAAAFERLGYTDVRVYEAGKLDWFTAGLSMQGARAAN